MSLSLTQRIQAVLDNQSVTAVVEMRIANHSAPWSPKECESYHEAMKKNSKEFATMAADDALLCMTASV